MKKAKKISPRMHYAALIALIISTTTTFLLGILITETLFNTGISYFAELPYAIKARKTTAAIGSVECCVPGNSECCERFRRNCTWDCPSDSTERSYCFERCRTLYVKCLSPANVDLTCYLNDTEGIIPPTPPPVTSFGGQQSGGTMTDIYVDIPDYSDFIDPLAPLTDPLP